MKLRITGAVIFFLLPLSIILNGCTVSAPLKKTSQLNPEEYRCKGLRSYISPSEVEGEKKRLLNLIKYVETGCLSVMSNVPEKVVYGRKLEHFPTFAVPEVLALAESIGRDRAITLATRLAEYDYDAAQVYLASKIEGTEKRRAVKLYQQAALRNECGAQLRLGWAHYKGTLVPQNLHMAFFWLSRAAEPPRLGTYIRTGLASSELRNVLREEGIFSQGGALQYLKGFSSASLGSPGVRSGRSISIECPSRAWLQSFLSEKFPSRVKNEVTPLLAQYLVGQPIPEELMVLGSDRSSAEGTDSMAANKELVLTETVGQLEFQKNVNQQDISQDTQSPSIRVATNSDGARGTISGTATDNTGIAEVLVDGQAVALDSTGRFTTSTFIPSGGIEVQITAYDLKGLSTTETVRLERSKRKQAVSRLAALNPLVGPKQKPSRDRVALIIGVEDYARAPSADYASGDAQMFADYAREKLGIADNNIKTLSDTGASKAEILRALKVWLPKAVKPDTTDLYVFYAGHGMPTADGTSAYLVPYDGDIQLLEDTAISRKRFFDEISATKPRSATFFFDNCFSGATRSEELLLASRPLGIKVQETSIPDNYLVFAAGETDQIAGVEPEVKHGRFSYFVFKGLEGEADANQDGKISAGELHQYVRESVGRFSAGAQTPTMLGDAGRWVLR